MDFSQEQENIYSILFQTFFLNLPAIVVIVYRLLNVQNGSRIN